MFDRVYAEKPAELAEQQASFAAYLDSFEEMSGEAAR
jgi:hypothetical protein